uniref:PGG domain-containing protein n=1 Tax=Quercus lobata TaxID=97700 RepID=A0A7N2LPM9_QUELO
MDAVQAQPSYSNLGIARLPQSAAIGRWDIVHTICRENWLLNVPITKMGGTVLHLAAYHKQEMIFEQLLQQLRPPGSLLAKVSLKRKNNVGNTPLHYAAEVGSKKICRSIIEFDRAESATLLSFHNDEGETPLFLAALHGYIDVFLYLHFKCHPGREHSNYCTRKNELALIILHLHKDLANLGNKKGITPLHLLASKPSAFKSGSNLRSFENIIYHSFAITNDQELIRQAREKTCQAAADEQNLERLQVTHGAPSETVRKVRMMKVRHTWSVLIMNNLLENASMYQFLQDKERKKDDIDQPATAILIAAKNGITEMVEKILERYPVAMYEEDRDRKNVVLLTVKHNQPRVYELLLLLLLLLRKKNTLKYSIFNEVDCDGNSALHLAAEADFNWPVLGAASQMQWGIKWYEYIKNSMQRSSGLPLLNKNGQTPEEVFTEKHKDLVKIGVPDGVKEVNKNNKASKVLAVSSFVSFCTSLIAVVMFLSILTSVSDVPSFAVG